MKPSDKKILAFIWLILCTILFTMPGSSLPKVSFLFFKDVDKLVHTLLFFILIILFCSGFAISIKQIWLWAFLGICYGILIEFIQERFIPLRSFDIFDIVADINGCLAAAVLKVIKKVKLKSN